MEQFIYMYAVSINLFKFVLCSTLLMHMEHKRSGLQIRLSSKEDVALFSMKLSS